MLSRIGTLYWNKMMGILGKGSGKRLSFPDSMGNWKCRKSDKGQRCKREVKGNSEPREKQKAAQGEKFNLLVLTWPSSQFLHNHNRVIRLIAFQDLESIYE